MKARRRGRTPEWEAAAQDGLTAVWRIRKDRKARIAFVFGLIRRLYRMGGLITERDDELAREVLQDLNFTRAARALRPDRPAAMRVRISARYAYFQSLCDYFLAPAEASRSFSARRRTKAAARLHPGTILRSPGGHSEAVPPKFESDPSYSPPVCGRTKKSPARSRSLLAARG